MSGTGASGPAQPPATTPINSGDVGGTAQEFFGWVANEGLKSQMASELERILTAHADDLAWLGGQKMLVQIRVGRSNSLVVGDPELVHNLRLISVEVLGVGGTPIDAMVSYLGGDRLIPGVPADVVEDRSLRKLAWIDEHGGIMNVVDPDAVGRVAFAIRADQLMAQQNERRIADERWMALDRAAAIRLVDIETRRIAQEMIRAARDAAARVDDIDRRLQAAIERQRRAAAALAWLDTLGAGLSIAQALSGLSDRLGADAPPAPLEMKDQQDLAAYTRELVTVTRDGVTVLQSERTTETRVYDDNRRRFEELRQQQGGGGGQGQPPGATPGRLP